MTQAQQYEVLTSVADVFEVVDRKTAMDLLDVKSPRISNAIKENVMSAHWKLVIEYLCEKQGKVCPDYLFSFIEAPTEQVCEPPPSEAVE